jgi:hypothetical protein
MEKIEAGDLHWLSSFLLRLHKAKIAAKNRHARQNNSAAAIRSHVWRVPMSCDKLTAQIVNLGI